MIQNSRYCLGSNALFEQSHTCAFFYLRGNCEENVLCLSCELNLKDQGLLD
jgi:hypothetical protein